MYGNGFVQETAGTEMAGCENVLRHTLFGFVLLNTLLYAGTILGWTALKEVLVDTGMHTNSARDLEKHCFPYKVSL